MFRKITSAVSSLAGSPGPLPPDHLSPAREKEYAELANALEAIHVPVSHADCASCTEPCADGSNGHTGNGTVAEIGNAWNGKTYPEYVLEKYGDLGELPEGFDTDWESDLPGSGGPPVGRVVVISTGKSNWLRDHVVSDGQRPT